MIGDRGTGLDATDDATMIVEIWTVLLVVFLLLFVLMAGARVPPESEPPPARAANELQAVVEGVPDPAHLVLVSDGSALFTVTGEAVSPATLARHVEPAHRSVSVVVPATARVVDLDRLREAIGSGIAIPVRFGRLPDAWVRTVHEWAAR